MEAGFLFLFGGLVGIMAGLLGIGGGVVMVPALMFLPPVWGGSAFSIVQATAISSVQCLASGVMALRLHAQRDAVAWRTLFPLAIGTLIGSALGGVLSSWIPVAWLYGLFCSILVLTLLKKSTSHPDPSASGTVHPNVSLAEQLAVTVVIGFISANTGVGGAIILLPYLIHRLKLPIRLAIGCGAGYVVFTALGSVAGKWSAHVVPWVETAWIALGAMIGAHYGARLSHRLPVLVLMRILKGIVALSLVKMLWQLSQSA